MKRIRPRISVRRMMVVVAILAIAMEAELLRRARRDRALKAIEYAAEAKSWAEDVAAIEGMRDRARARGDAPRAAELDEVAGNNRKLTDHYRKLASKYEQAAGRPWASVEPDEPGP